MIKDTVIEARKKFFRDIGELARFAEASEYIYKHFSITAEELKNEKLPNLTKIVKVEEVIESIVNHSVLVLLYENVIVRAYGTLEVFVGKVIDAIIRDSPIDFIERKKIDLSDLYEGDIEKLKEGFIEKAITDATSNKSMYVSIENIFNTTGIDLGMIKVSKDHVKDIYLLRNLIVHKNCLIDKKFIDNYSLTDNWAVGEKLICEYKTMSDSVNRLCQFVRGVSNSILK
jgi:hypothetical protein